MGQAVVDPPHHGLVIDGTRLAGSEPAVGLDQFFGKGVQLGVPLGGLPVIDTGHYFFCVSHLWDALGVDETYGLHPSDAGRNQALDQLDADVGVQRPVFILETIAGTDFKDFNHGFLSSRQLRASM